MENTVAALSPVDALFTATSAVCVTGLAVRDTGSEFTPFGQAVILLLVQAGGLGILTFSNAIFLARWRSFGLRERAVMAETVGLHPHIAPSKLIRRIFLYAFACEGAGAVVLTLRFMQDFPFGKALWLGVFHSVSAFCNAGFSLFRDNLISYRTDPVVNVTIMILIILGGLGFIVAADVMTVFNLRFVHRVQRRLSFHSRIVLRTTVLLIFAGWGLFFLLQVLGPSKSSWSELALETLFLSVTARTAGFNTLDLVELSNAGLLVLMCLMMIGGSPGSTAGGVKTTTVATLYALLRSRSANRPRVELLDRSIPHEVQGKALAGAAGFLLTVLVATVLMEMAQNASQAHRETPADFLPHLFEVVSALATVGLSTGITAGVTPAGKLILVACMFLGRLGTVIVAASLIGVSQRLNYSYPEERLMVG